MILWDEFRRRRELRQFGSKCLADAAHFMRAADAAREADDLGAAVHLDQIAMGLMAAAAYCERAISQA